MAKLLEAVQRIVLEPGSMRALGFCVSKEHAHYMARKFTEAGLESVALTGDDDPDTRTQRLNDLRAGRLRCIFSVEVLGEGVDVPDVDCLLLLRPTASATLFAQQLGRGLRRAEGKSHLTVIDLIGQHRREFRFDDRLSAIIDHRRGPVIDQVSNDFPFLPAGCTIDLDRQSREIVLDNLKAAVQRSRWSTLVSDLRRMEADYNARRVPGSPGVPARGHLPVPQLDRTAPRCGPRPRRGTQRQARGVGTESDRSTDPHRRPGASHVLRRACSSERHRRDSIASTSASSAC